MILQIQFIDLLLQLISQMSFAGDNQADRLTVIDQSGYRIDQMMKPFLLGQSPGRTNQQSLRIEAKSCFVPK